MNHAVVSTRVLLTSLVAVAVFTAVLAVTVTSLTQPANVSAQGVRESGLSKTNTLLTRQLDGVKLIMVQNDRSLKELRRIGLILRALNGAVAEATKRLGRLVEGLYPHAQLVQGPTPIYVFQQSCRYLARLAAPNEQPDRCFQPRP